MSNIRCVPVLPFIFTGLLVVGNGGVINAQTPVEAERPRINIGPVYVTPVFAIRYLGIDSNVFNSSEDPRSDFTFEAGPSVELLLPYRRLRFTVDGGVNYIYFQSYPSERGFNTNWAVRGEALLARVTLYSSLAFANTKDRLNLEEDNRRRHIQDGLELGLIVKASPKLDFEFSVRRESFSYDQVETGDPLADLDSEITRRLLNHESKGVRGRAIYRWTPLTTISLSADLTQPRYPLSPSRDHDVVRVGPAVEFKPAALIAGRAEVGVRSATYFSDTIPDSTKLYANLGLTYMLPGSTQLGVTVTRDAGDSSDPLEPYFVIGRFGISLRRPIAGRYDVIGTGIYTRYNYASIVDEEGQPIVDGRDMVGRSYSVSVGYVVRSGTRVGVGVWHDSRRYNRTDFADFDGLRVGTTVTYGF